MPCSSCRHGHIHGASGECRRYPARQKVYASYECGEYEGGFVRSVPVVPVRVSVPVPAPVEVGAVDPPVEAVEPVPSDEIPYAQVEEMAKAEEAERKRLKRLEYARRWRAMHKKNP